ncbi:hypothetical protein [Bacillus sp. T33-2]|uniref:hypothetical protein n=1 Tax=Bacillus sp. T33-2 TaxID=2054168 RepID=UPI000C77B7E2|nr:hypothetical protein [Bacillus sp. T33-2]PLR92845.1 hypothetical protein CVD19_19825 [Bacillus sp. T33-2]
MQLVLMIMLVAAMTVLFFSGYYVGMLRERHGKSWVMVVPIFIAVFMFNIIWALTELSKSARWQ